MDYTKHMNTKQTERLDKRQVKNNAGGFVYEVSPLEKLRRFLILGTEGGTYYVGERELTKEAAAGVIEAIQQSPDLALAEIVSISDAGRAPKNDPAIFALALVCTYGDEATKRAAYSAITQVCRTGTHLFQFSQAIQTLRGWSAGLRKGVASYYQKDVSQLAYQTIKYRQRGGWTHRDVLRLAHAKPVSPEHNALFAYLVGKSVPNESLPEAVQIFERLKTANEKQAVKFITDYNMPREALPTELLNSKLVWEALLQKMPLTAMIRNLGKMTAIGLLANDFDQNTSKVVEKLGDSAALIKARIHPLSILNALQTYSNGRGDKGKLTWTPIQSVVQALDKAFMLSFPGVEKTGKNFFLGLDVSGSMTAGDIAGMSITPRVATAAMAMVTAYTEKTVITAFSNNIVNFPIQKGEPLSLIMKRMDAMPFSSTDCSLPMIKATEQRLPIDTFVIYTDNETYAGRIQPKVALENYRQKLGRDAKLVVVGMTATGFTIADPADKGMFDVVGMDTATPQLISDFTLNRF